jgi:hypothetical protein
LAYTGRELPSLVTSVQLYDLFAPKWMLAELGTAGDMLPLPDARIGAVEPYSQRDVAAFRVAPSASIHPLRLAAALPAKGEPIWLAVNRGGGLRERTIQAIAVEITGQTLIFRFAAGATMPPSYQWRTITKSRGRRSWHQRRMRDARRKFAWPRRPREQHASSSWMVTKSCLARPENSKQKASAPDPGRRVLLWRGTLLRDECPRGDRMRLV